MKYKREPIYQRKPIGRRAFLKTLGLGLGALAIPTTLFAGTGLLNGQEVHVDPPPDTDVLVGYKGQTGYEAGYFYCPYVPLMTTDGVPATRPFTVLKTRYGLI